MNKVFSFSFTLLLIGCFPNFTSANNPYKTDSLCWYPETFENTDSVFPPQGWQIVDSDGDIYNWFLYISTDENFNYAHSGSGFAASASWIDQQILFPDNHLITPPVLITTQNNLLSFWVAAQDPDFPAEHFSIRILSADSNIQFKDTVIWNETLGSSNWSERKIKLTRFEGKSIRIDFRHHDCSDMFQLKLDDVNLLPFVNHAPEFITSPDYAMYDQNGYRYNIKAVDEDYDFVQIKPVSIPYGFNLSQTQNGTAVITGFCQYAFSQYFEIEASDGELNDFQTWFICEVDDFPEYLETNEKECIFLSPNPATNFIQLDGIPVCDLKITGLCGNKYLDLKNIKENEKIDVSGLSDGLYLVAINSANHITTLKLNIVH